MRPRLLLVLSCRVFQAGKVEELGGVIGAWVVAPGDDNNDGQIHLSETLWILPPDSYGCRVHTSKRSQDHQ